MCKLCSLKDDEIMSKQELEEAKKKKSQNSEQNSRLLSDCNTKDSHSKTSSPQPKNGIYLRLHH